MLKYQGKYRVLCEVDIKTGKPCEFGVIPCLIKKGSNICRQNGSVLNLYIPSTKIANRLLKEYPDLFNPLFIGDSEAVLLFNESDIEQVASIVKAKVKGRNKSPNPKRKYAISEERKQILINQLKAYNSGTKNELNAVKTIPTGKEI